jgi:hypothetical protein
MGRQRAAANVAQEATVTPPPPTREIQFHLSHIPRRLIISIPTGATSRLTKLLLMARRRLSSIRLDWNLYHSDNTREPKAGQPAGVHIRPQRGSCCAAPSLAN